MLFSTLNLQPLRNLLTVPKWLFIKTLSWFNVKQIIKITRSFKNFNLLSRVFFNQPGRLKWTCSDKKILVPACVFRVVGSKPAQKQTTISKLPSSKKQELQRGNCFTNNGCRVVIVAQTRAAQIAATVCWCHGFCLSEPPTILHSRNLASGLIGRWTRVVGSLDYTDS